ncbi:MAG: hypothetical protein ABI945_06565 [Nitrospirales bacterium]
MTQWAEMEAEIILDRLTLHNSPDDLLMLQKAIAKSLGRWYEMGRTDTLPDEYAF